MTLRLELDRFAAGLAAVGLLAYVARSYFMPKPQARRIAVRAADRAHTRRRPLTRSQEHLIP
jgi:hypothetical protein